MYDQRKQFEQAMAAANQTIQAQAATLASLTTQMQTASQIQHAQPGPAAVEKRIQAVLDPGRFDGSPRECGPWVASMRLWLKANEAGLKTKFDQTSAVLSRVKGGTGSKASIWAKERMEHYSDTNAWDTGEEALKSVERAFLPSTNIEWARRKVETLNQGTRRVEEWLAEFSGLCRQGQVESRHAMDILLRKVNPKIKEDLFRTGALDKAHSIEDLATATMTAGVRLEKLAYHLGSNVPRWGSHQPTKKELPMGEPMDIGAAQTRRPGPRGGCFICKGPHFKSDCPQNPARTQQGGNARAPAPRQARTAEVVPVEKSPVEGMDYDQMRAHFFDLYETEVRSGKEEES